VNEGEEMRGSWEGVGSSAEGILEETQTVEGMLAAVFTLSGVGGWRGCWWWRGFRRGTKAEAGDLEIFFEAIGLEEVGEFEGTDIATALADFALEVGDDGGQIVQGMTGTEQFEPESFPVVTQVEGLAGELTVELVGVVDGGCILGGGWVHERERFGVGLGSKAKTSKKSFSSS
jgi:hypothetical protein